MYVTLAGEAFGSYRVYTTTNTGVTFNLVLTGNLTQCLMLIETYEKIGFKRYQ